MQKLENVELKIKSVLEVCKRRKIDEFYLVYHFKSGCLSYTVNPENYQEDMDYTFIRYNYSLEDVLEHFQTEYTYYHTVLARR